MTDYAEDALVMDLQARPELGPLLCESLVKLRTGFWTDEYVAIVMDRWGDGALTFSDVYCFMQVHTMIGLGECVMTQIDTGNAPHGDKHGRENNLILERLPAPFEGRFMGGAGDDDGHIAWSEPIRANVISEGKETRATIPPGRAALEVGHTKGSTTLMHLQREKRLARWPYGATQITILHVLPDNKSGGP